MPNEHSCTLLSRQRVILAPEEMHVWHTHRRSGLAARDLDMVVHGDDFIVAGSGEDLDWLSQKLNCNLHSGSKPYWDQYTTMKQPC